jgi:4-hydroxythreonine-4-phosphate dehydrogenase
MRSSNIVDLLASTPSAPLVVSMGDPAGIGPEILAKAWVKRKKAGLPAFFATGDARAIAAVWDGPVETILHPAAANGVFDHALPVLTVEDGGEIIPGHPDVAGARCALRALELAAGLVRSGAARALVTAPVSKAQLYHIGFNYPGQTEFVAERCGIAGENAVMMLAGPDLRVVPITTHVPLAEVGGLLSVDLLVAKGIATPRIAFAGLNPHAGEGGAIGREEIEIIIPAVAQLVAEGIAATGPFAADTLFHPRARLTYDAVMCCYHDQALIPIKTLYFDEGVNITLGLPIVRTSPDHGTAFNIAGQNVAEPGAMIAAIRLAGDAADRRAATSA